MVNRKSRGPPPRRHIGKNVEPCRHWTEHQRASDSVLYRRQRPSHAAGIEAVSAEWAALEEYLTLAMVRSLLAFSHEEAFSIASTTLETIESPSTRLDVVAALLKIHASKTDFEFFATTLRPENHKRASERNRILQSIWYVDDRYPDHVITRLEGRYVKYSVHDITEVSDRIITTANSIREFVERF